MTEIRRFCDTKDWFHITTEKNVADLGTRPALVAEIARDRPGRSANHG